MTNGIRIAFVSMSLVALLGCGVDGRPVRPSPDPDPAPQSEEQTTGFETAPSVSVSGTASVGVTGGSSR